MESRRQRVSPASCCRSGRAFLYLLKLWLYQCSHTGPGQRVTDQQAALLHLSLCCAPAVVQIYALHGVVPLIESAVRNEAELQRVQELLMPMAAGVAEHEEGGGAAE